MPAGAARNWLALVAALATVPTGCVDTPADAPGVNVLAKVGDWRQELRRARNPAPYATLEIAPDRATAWRAWAENVPEILPPGTEDGYGRYGGFNQVDFKRQALVVWSSGQSSSCPAWIVDVRTTAGGTVQVEVAEGRWREEQPLGPNEVVPCTLDYTYYRMVLAVDRDRLPDLASLPSDTIVGVSDGLVTLYPYDPPDR